MTIKLLPILLFFLLLSGCSHKIEIEHSPLNVINQQLDLGWLATETTPISGYYTTDGDDILDGSFTIKSITPPIQLQQKPPQEQLLLTISGEFEEGRKTGDWRYDYEYSDGGTLYEKYSITFSYLDGRCQQGSIQGVIGKNMPTKEFSFYQDSLCDPMQLREKMMDVP